MTDFNTYDELFTWLGQGNSVKYETKHRFRVLTSETFNTVSTGGIEYFSKYSEPEWHETCEFPILCWIKDNVEGEWESDPVFITSYNTHDEFESSYDYHKFAKPVTTEEISKFILDQK